jgi:hypothetical protein
LVRGNISNPKPSLSSVPHWSDLETAYARAAHLAARAHFDGLSRRERVELIALRTYLPIFFGVSAP